MSIEKHYNALEDAKEASLALPYLFLATGDAYYTAEKRVSECFFTRGRGRKMDTSDMYSYVQSTDDLDTEEDTQVEDSLNQSKLNILNTFLEAKISGIETEYKTESRITKNMKGRILDLKSIYAHMLSKIYDPNELKDFISPSIVDEPWESSWDLSHLDIPTLDNYSTSEIMPPDKGETKLFRAIRSKIAYDRYKILDTLINHFKSTFREDLVDYIKVNGFKFISDSTSGISDSHQLTEEDFAVVNAARVTYISRRKIDLNYSLELIGLPATTYKKRSSKIKLELLDLGDELGDGVNNQIKDYLIA